MQSDPFRVGFFDSYELDISWQRETAEIVTRFSKKTCVKKRYIIPRVIAYNP